MLNRSILAALAAAGLFVVGCEDKKTDVEKAVDKAADKTEKAVDKAADTTKKATSDATDATGDAMKAAGDKLKEGGEAVKEKAAEIAPDTTKQVEELYNKAKAAIDSGKLEDAKPLLDQLQALAAKVPPEWQEKIKALAVEYGKKAAAGAIPGLPK